MNKRGFCFSTIGVSIVSFTLAACLTTLILCENDRREHWCGQTENKFSNFDEFNTFINETDAKEGERHILFDPSVLNDEKHEVSAEMFRVYGLDVCKNRMDAKHSEAKEGHVFSSILSIRYEFLLKNVLDDVSSGIGINVTNYFDLEKPELLEWTENGNYLRLNDKKSYVFEINISKSNYEEKAYFKSVVKNYVTANSGK